MDRLKVHKNLHTVSPANIKQDITSYIRYKFTGFDNGEVGTSHNSGKLYCFLLDSLY